MEEMCTGQMVCSNPFIPKFLCLVAPSLRGCLLLLLSSLVHPLFSAFSIVMCFLHHAVELALMRSLIWLTTHHIRPIVPEPHITISNRYTNYLQVILCK
jgi:hypothetical protein